MIFFNIKFYQIIKRIYDFRKKMNDKQTFDVLFEKLRESEETGIRESF